MNPIPLSLPATCPGCHVAVGADDNYCRACGRSLKKGYGFCYSHSGIILLALVLGPLALPWVWLSKRIGTVAKIIYSLVLFVIGYYLVLTCYQVFQLVQQATQLMLGGF